MALTKANITTGALTPGFNTQPANQGASPPILDRFEVVVFFQVMDDDGVTPLANVSKAVDVFPSLSGPQQNSLRNLVAALTNFAGVRA